MLYITLERPENMIFNSDVRFNNTYRKEWMLDPFVKEMILDVDKSEVIEPDLVKSPVFGYMPIEKISGGVKALILMYEQDKPVWATACGDNCSKWILEIANKKDLLICIESFLHFPENMKAIVQDDGTEITCARDWSEYMIKYM